MPLKQTDHQNSIILPLNRTYSSQVLLVGDMELVGPQTAKEVKDQETPKNGLAHRPKPSTRDLRDIESLHIKIADDLCEITQKDDHVRGKVGLSLLEDYSKRRKDILTLPGPKDATIFHAILDQMQELAKNDGRTEFIQTVPFIVGDFLEHLVIKHQDLLIRSNESGQRPLDIAAKKLKPVVFLVASLILPESKLKELPVKQCLAKKEARPGTTCTFDLPASLKFKFAKKLQNNPSKPCVHDTVDMEEVGKWHERMKATLSQALGPCEKDKTEKRIANSDPPLLHTLLEYDSFTKEASNIKTEGFQRLIELCDEKTLQLRDSRDYSPLHRAISLYKTDRIDYNRLHIVIASLVKKYPNSIYDEIKVDGVSQNPYCLLQSLKPSEKNGSPDHEERLNSWRETEKLLKYACIRGNRDQDLKLVYLYGDIRDAKNIYLDMGFPVLIDKTFVESLSDTVEFRFDTALEYVSLRQDSDEKEAVKTLLQSPQNVERNPYRGVFEWLRENGVEKIFKVIIEDIVPLPHTDEAIRKALEGLGVEVWDWRKLDICAQTIIHATKGVRQLYLHSSGNEAVLHSWACEHGLTELNELESITITMHPDLRETKVECERMFKDFQNAVSQRKPNLKGKVELEWANEPTSSIPGNEDKGSIQSPYQSDEVAWVRNTIPLSDFLDTVFKNRYQDKKDRPYVTIALIDDGVYTGAATQGIPRIAAGKSYYGQQNRNLHFRDFYTGPSQHGTKMASFINKICPMVQLYVARMDDSRAPIEKFTVDSAIEAVKWAIKMKVDIISMSWTFKEKEAASEQTEAFRKAIQEANHAGIILLNSLNDREMTIIDDLLPTSYNEIIRIGSATKWGKKSESNKQGDAHYLFPGQEIPIKNSEGENEMVSGSSVATAFAAGLAALIIYAARALICIDETLNDNEKQCLRAVASRKGIEQVFKLLGGKPDDTSPQDIYVGLGKYFAGDLSPDAGMATEAQSLKSFLTQCLIFKY
ncbi:hypothetical protein V8C35DRAFT_285649 [Trichoderma chlorosporum]